MKKKMLCALSALMLSLSLLHTSIAQAPKKVYSEVYYHKIKPGHTMAEARAFENEFKKVHQVQADEGSILGWYMLALDMTTNPNKEYSYVTIKNVSDPGYFDNAYPEATMKKGWGTEYQKKMTDLMIQGREVTETSKIEVWEILEGATATPLPSPDKAPIWMVTNIKVKNSQYEEYMALVKKAKPFYQERVVTGGAVVWNFAGLLFPWASEKSYDFSMVNMFPSMKAIIESGPQAEAAFKKTMPGMDYKQFYKDMDNLRETARQEFYYLVEYAVKTAPAQAASK
ncbi:hypothetical protein [Spirosoma validum]|uniref:Uncharacterized protein n=1 Tax=Spirosoma validum TaxID=2771355 RepID=A0A927B8N9_9BACT|nr:hypothetical protein [Spirosoma validum]MBD2757232.1 hypothetical protein [Spirosoma validum]